MRAQLLSATGLAAAVLAVQAPPVQAQSAPAGSYERSCSNIRASGGVLTADCPADSGQYRSSSIRFQDCRGDISNRNGLLSCSGATASTAPVTGQDALGQIAGAILGGLLGQQPGATQQPLYQEGYRYPTYGQQGYGDSRYDPRFGSEGWGYGRDRQWVSIADRRGWFDARVDAGVRQGRLSSREPADLRRQFEDLVRLETQYGRGGLTNSERSDLDGRFDQLAARIQISSGWTGGGSGGSTGYGLESRRTDFERAVDDGQRRNRITRTEAARLRADFEDLIDRETGYARNGIDRNEQADLDRRYDDLVARAGGTSSGGGGGNWSGQTVADRAPALDAQIETQRRAGRLSRTDAARLGDELDTLVRLEQDYARNGLTRQEGEELERRYQDIVSRVPGTSGVITPAVLGPVEERRSSLLSRIDTAERSRRINRTEAQRLRTEVDELLRMEQDYARDGLSAGERAYLENRLNGIEALLPR